MRNRKLTQEEAFEEYLIYQIRLFEFAEMFQVANDILGGVTSQQLSVVGQESSEPRFEFIWPVSSQV